MLLDEWIQDVRFAIRQLRTNATLSAIAIAMLALGIGANTALFSVVNGVLLNPLPYPAADRIVAIYEVAPGFSKASMSYLNFLDWQRTSRTFASMSIYRYQDYNFAGAGEGASAERVTGMMVSADFFRTFGQTPVVGRDLTAPDDRPGAAPVAIISGGFWQRRFGASPSVLGQTVSLNGKPYTIIGVMPASYALAGAQHDVYTAIGQWTDPNFRDRGAEASTHAVGRLGPGVSLAQAQADLNIVARDLSVAYPTEDKNIGITILSLKDDLVGNVRPLLFVLLGAVGFLLLIACVNVANLLLARALSRTRELAVRVALGATPGRLMRQLFTEGAVLAALGGSLGLLLAVVGTRAARTIVASALPRTDDIAIDARVLGFTIVACAFAAIVFGLAPALRGARADVQSVLKESTRGAGGGRHRTQRAFVAIEVALALVLLVGAGLMLRTLQALWRVDPGFDPRGTVTFSVSLPGTPQTTATETRARLRRLHAAMRDVPGVDAVSITLGSRPLLHDTSLPFWVDGRPKPANLHDMPMSMVYLVEPTFRSAMGQALRRGRFVTDNDDERAPVAVDIDDAFARLHFPNENPVGRRINLTGFDVQAEIVGVVGHIRQWGLGADPTAAVEGQIYYPFMQMPDKIMALAANSVAVVLRTRGSAGAVTADLRRAISDVEPGDVIYDVKTFDGILAASLAPRRIAMTLLSAFAGLALLLACLGLYGVISYLVHQRTHEIGVRLALGAQRAHVIRLVLDDGLRMAALGAAAGLLTALALARLMASQLFGVTAHDPLTFAVVALLLMLIAVAACFIPARRATRVDPATALRSN
jgi:predicted permease